MNGSTVATSGEADLGTVITSHQDISGKQDITDNTLTTTNKTVPTAINEVNSIAKGANQAVGYNNYQTMITAFNTLSADEYQMGQNIYIVTVNVPDLWVSSVESTSSTYTYVDDATFVSALETNGYVQVGYYKLSMLETQKVDLTNYVTNTDYAGPNRVGVIRTNPDYGTSITSVGALISATKTYRQYQDTTTPNMFISKGTLENVIEGKGLVSKTDYATSQKAGVVKKGSYDFGVDTNGYAYAYDRTYSVYLNNHKNCFISKGTLENVITGKGLIDNTYHDSSKQDTLVSGTNIKTINNTSILGSGNISLPQVTDSYSASTTDSYSCNYVNELNTFSTTEARIGTWIDGKPIYRKSVFLNSLPNNTSTNYAHNINNVDLIWFDKSACFAIWNYGQSNQFTNSLTFYNQTGAGHISLTNAGKTGFDVITTNDRSSLKGYITLLYTKTTD